MLESIGSEGDVGIMKERASTTNQTQGKVKTNTLDKQEHLWELSRALAILALTSVSESKLLYFPD